MRSGACTVEGCNHAPVAKGLCSKHYMQARRAGQPKRKRGRPTPEDLALYRRFMGSCLSPRSLARYAKAMRILKIIGESEEHTLNVIELSTRETGKLNVTRMLLIARMRFAAEWNRALREARLDGTGAKG
jgi:hypothetical protein